MGKSPASAGVSADCQSIFSMASSMRITEAFRSLKPRPDATNPIFINLSVGERRCPNLAGKALMSVAIVEDDSFRSRQVDEFFQLVFRHSGIHRVSRMDSNEVTQAQRSEGGNQGHLPRYRYL